MARRKISVVGLGKLGFCLAVVLASKGYDVFGVDADASKIDFIKKGKSPIYEPGLERLLRRNRTRLSVSTNYNSIVNTFATFVVVPTPSEKSGEFSLEFVKQTMQRVGESLKEKNGYHLVVLTSTVLPGSMDTVVLPLLESSSGKRCGMDFGLCYNPEFIALGDVITGLLQPDFILIGESDRRAGDFLSRIQKMICNNSPEIERMNFTNAELAKISLNSFVTMKMSFANTLAEICENMPGGDVDLVTKAIGKDRRIGSAYLRGALGYGGPCFPRDNIAFATFANKVGCPAKLALTTHEVNLRQVSRLLDLIESELPFRTSRIAILGLSYKPNTNITDASQSMMIAEALAERGHEVHAYDPAITEKFPSTFQSKTSIILESRVEDCVRKAEVCIIATPWKIFSRLNSSLFRNKIVIDCWRTFEKIPDCERYLALGKKVMTPKLIAV